jgi:hypothetical protein
VPPPPVVAAPPPSVVTAAAPSARPTPGLQAQAAPTASTTPPPPVTPEEAELLTGDDWSRGKVEDQPSTAGDELRVAVIGDSLAHNIAGGLETWAQEQGGVVVYDLSISFCPLSRGGERRWEGEESFDVNEACGWWDDPSSERASAYASFAPDVVIDVAGFSEMLDRRLPGWGDWRRPGDRSYDSWLLDEYKAMGDALHALGSSDSRLLNLNAPCGDFGRPRGWRRVDDPDGRITALDDGVYPYMFGGRYGNLFDELCPNGVYQDDLWGIEDARPDGMHLSDEAAAELARRWLGPLVLDTAGPAPSSGVLATPTTTSTTTPPP